MPPRLPQNITPPRVTSITRQIWAADTPPKSTVNMKTGSPASNITTTSNNPAESLPSTSSRLVMSVESNKTSVPRSFSWATEPATRSAAKNKAISACNGARIWNKRAPNRARSPTSRTCCVPLRTSHAVPATSPRAAA